MEHRNTNNEIDLLEGLANSYLYIVKNKFIITGCLLIGVLSGFMLYKLTNTSTWKATMMVSTVLMAPQEGDFVVKEMSVDQLNGIGSRNHRINLVPSVTYDKDTQTLFVKFAVTADSKEIFSALQSALIDYLNKCEPLVRKKEERRLYYQDLIKMIDHELELLEKAKINYPGISDYYKNSVELYNKKAEYQHLLEVAKPVQLVKGFDPQEFPKKMIYLIIGMISGLFLSIIIMFLKFFIPYYKQFLKTQA